MNINISSIAIFIIIPDSMFFVSANVINYLFHVSNNLLIFLHTFAVQVTVSYNRGGTLFCVAPVVLIGP